MNETVRVQPATAAKAERAAFNPTVHGARGLFASMVFVYHIIHSGLPGLLPETSWLSVYLLNAFKFGVELFFGISGYVILGALRRAPSMRSFAWDRVSRILPLLWLTLLVITAGSLATRRWMPSFGNWLLNFLAPPPFVSVPMLNPAAWSLGYELTFYALCAAFWVLPGRGRTRWVVMAAVLGAALLMLFPRAVLFPAGLAIAAGALAWPGVRMLSRFPFLLLLGFLVGWRAIELNFGGDMLLVTPLHLPLASWAVALPLLAGTALLGALALAGISAGKGAFAAVLRTAPLQWLGTISFSFYLWQPAVMGPVKAALTASGLGARAGQWSQLLFALMALPAVLVIAHFSQIWIEAKLTRALRRMGPREGDAHAPITATSHAPGHGAAETIA